MIYLILVALGLANLIKFGLRIYSTLAIIAGVLGFFDFKVQSLIIMSIAFFILFLGYLYKILTKDTQDFNYFYKKLI